MQPVRLLGLLIVLLLGFIGVYVMSPAKSLVDGRNHAIDQLYLAHFTERISSLAGGGDRVTAHVVMDRQIPESYVSQTSGYFDEPLRIELRTDDERYDIYFTTDGSIPTRLSHRYSEPIEIRESTTLRARVLPVGQLPGAVATYTYIVGEDLELPILALTSDPAGLFDDWAGIFRDPFERGEAWHRPTIVTYISDSRDRVTTFEAGIKIHGNYTRDLPKKSLRLFYAADKDQLEDMPPVFRPTAGSPDHQVVLRQGGDDHSTRFRSMLFDSLLREIGGIATTYEPVFVFINGDPIGIYNVRDYIDINFLRRRFGAGDYDLIIDGDRVKAGDSADFFELIAFLEAQDLANPENFDVAASKIDVSNTLDYWLANIYAASVDWPGRNTYIFRATSDTDQKWRWISWDKDISFNKYDTELEHNTLAYAIRDTLRDDLLWHYAEFDRDTDFYLDGTVIIRNLLENESFRSRFILRCLDLLNSHFSSDNVERHLQTLIDIARKDVARDREIWSIDEARYLEEVETIRHFAKHRPDVVRRHLREAFDLGADVTVRLAVEPAGSGTILLNSIRPETYPWMGVYFEGVSVSLTASAASGYRFRGWNVADRNDKAEIIRGLNGDTEFVAIFEPTGQ
ncbi:MAG: hypothetical protein HKN65_09990 [Woeseiaceae bacterium]|nr:hypothetical protein [Woeseiaceae bacterium]